SSNSLSLLPSEPKIFYGRESEVSDILKLFRQGIPRIAILGPGGMGKTSLAKAVLHCEDIAMRYIDHRFFVSCESALTKVELTILIGAHLGLKGSKDLTQALIQHFLRGPPCLLVLDNLETLWEQVQFQGAIEEFLSLLAEVEHLALIVTMRGGERPAKVQWTRPFLQPLIPLVQHAARQTFEAIADDVHNAEDVEKILLLTGNVPLVIDLVSHLVASDGCFNVLSRWEEEATAMISQGHDRRSNLDLSISLSLTSPRMKSVPHSRDLLSLLSMLPDGLSDLELQQSKLPIDNILTCKAALIRTSLAYQDKQKRLRVLVPIQEYMQQYYPPTPTLTKPLLSHFQELLKTCNETESPEITSRIIPNFANIQNLLSPGLKEDNPDLMKTVQYTLFLAGLGRTTGWGNVSLVNQIPGLIYGLHSPKLELRWLTFSMQSYFYQPLPNPEAIISQGLAQISACNDQVAQVEFLGSVVHFYLQQENGMSYAQKFSQQAFEFSAGNIKCQSSTTCHLALIHLNLGDHIVAIGHARQSRKLAQLAGNPMAAARAL
ncbi:P-loop containing nucleoside triphosphate hydrolase protein, partial [Mycena metata]